MESLLSSNDHNTHLSHSFLPYLLHFLLFLSHSILSLASTPASSRSTSRSLSVDALSVSAMSPFASVMINQLSVLLYHLLQDLSAKQSFLISPDVIALFTSNLLQLLPRAVVNSAAWIQVLLELSFLLVARFHSGFGGHQLADFPSYNNHASDIPGDR